jgi:hypothetical protein
MNNDQESTGSPSLYPNISSAQRLRTLSIFISRDKNILPRLLLQSMTLSQALYGRSFDKNMIVEYSNEEGRCVAGTKFKHYSGLFRALAFMQISGLPHAEIKAKHG